MLSCHKECMVSWLPWSLVKSVHVKCPTLSTDRPEHLMLFRTHVSRTAAGKGRAVLKGVGLNSTAISGVSRAIPRTRRKRDNKVLLNG